MFELQGGPGLNACLIAWRDAVRSVDRITIAARATFEWRPGAVARLTSARPVVDMAPWKPLADVVVEVAPAEGRVLYGIAVARGADVLLGKRCRSSEELSAVAWRGGPGAVTVAADTPVDAFQCARPDLRMGYLRGGEQVLLVGVHKEEVLVRLPALTAHAVIDADGSTRQLALAADHLFIDVAAGEVSVTWRGAVPGPRPTEGRATVTLTPTAAIEDTVGSPPSWTRRRKPVGLGIVNCTPLQTARLLWSPEPNRWRCTLVAKGTFDIRANARAVLAATQEPMGGDTVEGDILVAGNDLVPVKANVDVVVRGKARAEGKSLAVVRLTLANIDKTIVALGERSWSAGVLTEPRAFESLDLDYRHAFGGPGSENPAGTGTPGTPPPRIELPDRLMRKPTDSPPPAGFGPIHSAWPARARKLGTADETWARTRWPALPQDADVGFFNAAPEDQQCAELAGDEHFVVTNVRPAGTHLAGELPAMHPTFFVAYTDGRTAALVPRLDTVAIDAETERLNLIWRASCDVADEDASDLRGFLVAEEGVTEDTAWERLTVEGDRRFDVGVQSAPAREPWVTALASPLFALVAAERDALPSPPPPPTRDHIAALAKSDELSGQDLTGADLTGLDLAGRNLTATNLTGAFMQGCKLDGANLTEANLAHAACRDTSWRGAQLFRADFAGADLEGAVFDEATMEHATLVGCSLRGASLRRAVAPACRLMDADLTGAALDDAQLIKANLTGARIDSLSARQCMLDHALLFDVKGESVRLDGSSLKEANLERAELPGVVLDGAMLDDAGFASTELSKASLVGVRARRARFARASLTGAKLTGADLMHARLDRADLSRADLSGANLYQVTLTGALLRGATLDNAHVAGTLLAPRDDGP